ncbi:hypothetical protein ACFSUD_09685 [Sulfitobacter aestuarii]|uniref:Glyceraldehyde-3-phosphate dehydrogenase n=1 Tax=Sulfitobacter aestuarii TaxID=2161676 RepID=A0ABW5U4M3_9RHOB
MTNLIALILGLVIVGALALDGLIYGSEHFVYLGKKFFELIEWMAFWR